MVFAGFTNADSVLQQIASQADGDGALAINGSTLYQWLTTLQKTSTQLSQELQQQVAVHADTSFLPAYHYNDQVHQRADRQVQEALTSSQNFLNSASAMATQTTQASSDTLSLAHQAHHSHTIVTTLKSLVAVSKDLDQVDTFLAQGAIVDATRQLLVVLDSQANEQSDGGELAVRYHLRTRAERYKTFLANTIHDGLMQSIVLTNDGDMVLDLSIRHSIAFAHGSANTTLELKDLLMASSLLQTQCVELASIQRHIIKKLITPLLNGGGNTQQSVSQGSIQLTVDELHEPAVSKLHLIMTPPATHYDDDIDNTTALKAYEARCSAALDRIQHTLAIVRFLFEHAFGFESHWTTMRQLFGRLFLPDVFQLVINSTLSPAIPSTTTSTDVLTLLASLASSAAAFEQQCIVEYAGITASSSTDDNNEDFPLTRYVSQLDQHVARQRRCRLLHDARQVMLRQIYDAEPETNDGISITQTPRILRAMIQEITAEAVSLEQQQHYPTTSLTLRNTVHDILVLYMSIMPSIHRPELLRHADRAIVFRNDCYWLATHTQQDAIGDIRSKLEQLGDFWQKVVVAQLMNTVAIVLDRTEEWHQDGDGQQQQQGNMALDSKQPMDSSQQQQQQSMSLENAITIIIAQVQSLANSIRPVVTPALYNTILIQLVNGAVGRLTEDLLAMADISAEASHTMALALNGVAQLANVFLSDSGSGVSEIQLRQWIPRWQGFWMIKEMLELTMADILAALHRGDLCMFTHQELVHLVCALFADTPRRDETLQIIKTSDLNGFTATKDIASLLDPVMESPMVKHSPQPQQHIHDRGISASSPQFDEDLTTTSSRLAFDMEENNDDDGWDQGGWSDDDDLDFSTTLFRKDSTQTKQELQSAQGGQMDDGSLNMDTDVNEDFDPRMNMPLDKSMEDDNDLDPGMIIPQDDQDSHHLDVGDQDKEESTQTIQEHQRQENLSLDHSIGESRGVESDKNDELSHEMNTPMQKSADIILENDNDGDFDFGMNMTLDDQDNHYLGLDNEDQFDKVDMNQELREDSPPLDRTITDESPGIDIDADKDGVLDDGMTKPLDLKDRENLGVLLEDEDSYSKNEPTEAAHIHHEVSRSPEVEQRFGGGPDMDASMNDALDHGMNIPLGDHRTHYLDEEDNHVKDQVEGTYTGTTQEYHEDSQSPQNEYPIGEISDMDTEMIDDFDASGNKPQDELDVGNDLKFGMDLPSENQDRSVGNLSDDGDEDVDSTSIMPLDDKVNHYLGVPLESEDNSGKEDDTQITREYREDSLLLPNEHTIGGTIDVDVDENNDFDSGMMLLDTSLNDHDNTMDTLMNRSQYDTNKHGLGTFLEDETNYGKDDLTKIHQAHHEDSGSPASEQSVEQNLVRDPIKNDDGDLRTDVPLGNLLDNIPANDNYGALDHEMDTPLGNQDNQALGVDAKDNHDKGDHTGMTQGYHEGSQRPKHAAGNNIDSNEEKDHKDIDLDTGMGTSKEKLVGHWKNGSLYSNNQPMDLLLDDEEGGGWSDADHDIDLDLDLLSRSALMESLPPPPSKDYVTNTTSTATRASLSPTETEIVKNIPPIPSPQNSPATSPRSYSQTASFSSPNNPSPPPTLLQHQQSPVVKASPSPSPSPSPSKFSVIEDVIVDENYDDEEGGGWSDAENIMEFDTTISPKVPTLDRSNNTHQPDVKTSAHYPVPTHTTNSNNNDTNAANNNSMTPSARSNFMMDLALEDDDDTGGGWSDADEELF